MEIQLFEGQLMVELPDSFQEMTEEKAEEIYPYEARPQILWEDEEENRFCSFSLLEEQELQDGQVERALGAMEKAVRYLYPSGILEEPQVIKKDKRTYGWFSFVSAGVEGKLLNRMYIFPVNGSMMLGTMVCGLEDQQGKEQMEGIMDSLQAVRKSMISRMSARRW